MGSCQDQLDNLKGLRNYIGTDRMAPEAISWLDGYITASEMMLKADPNSKCGLKLTKRTDLDDSGVDMQAVKRYAGGLSSRRSDRSLFFGRDPFNQKTREEAIADFSKNIADEQAELGKLETRLATLQKTWYSRIRDSWSNFWSASRTKVASWRLW